MNCLFQKKARVSRGFIKWKENICLGDTAVSKAFFMVRSILSETFIRSFQLKILNDITFTIAQLRQAVLQTTFVLFAKLNQKLCITQCCFTNRIWYDFAYFWFQVSGKRVDLTPQDVLLGKLDAEIDLLNVFFITLVKLHIWISRKHGVTPYLSAFKDIVKVKFRTKKYIAMKNNTERNFQARWQVYINSSLYT